MTTDSLTVSNDLDFWEQPGLYVYTSIGNLLLFRLCWAWNLFVWNRYDINYIPILKLSNTKSNLLQVCNTTATLFLMYCINLIVFFRANASVSVVNRYAFLSYGCPFILIVWSIIYELYEHITFPERSSRGLFTRNVLKNCLMAPFATLTFRDIYAADVLTSFSKVICFFISDFLSCRVVSCLVWFFVLISVYDVINDSCTEASPYSLILVKR